MFTPAASGELSHTPNISDLPGGDETILLIDDDDTVRHTTRRMLEYKGYEVLLGVDGRDGLEIYQRERRRISLVLLDLLMPEMSGEEVLARLRTIDPLVNVVYFTGYSPEEIDTSDVFALVPKPFTFTFLLQTIRRAIDRGSARKAGETSS